MRQRLLNSKQAAQYFGITERTLYNWVKRGLFKPVKIPGGHNKYDIKTLQNAINSFKKVDKDIDN